MYENQRDQMSAQAFNVEQTSFAIDTVKDTHVTIAAMKVCCWIIRVLLFHRSNIA